MRCQLRFGGQGRRGGEAQCGNRRTRSRLSITRSVDHRVVAAAFVVEYVTVADRSRYEIEDRGPMTILFSKISPHCRVIAGTAGRPPAPGNGP